ncbi:SDR family NAD(P)-dependent oxidoreductase [Phenylobacterium parvum]|uniref:D-xylose 1-dehydrogenase n=1 Tax=Phenylobacterium parvum TaxID=2201350 RepID=A0A2Z3I2C3_9CAUL|nr:SDR family NAD(P)-dependent oxidoreductase [Phenylobacterium parvum]AWM77918.1 NAD(P)-dependent oxidoreductase [Phenylobacterium parvum]
MSQPAALSRSLQGSIVHVTGAGSGMGRATAEIFAAEGAHVAATDFRGETAEATAEAIRATGGSARAWALDVSDADEVRRVTGEVAGHFGGLDILVNNAGISAFSPIDSNDYDAAWAKSLAVLLTAHQLTIRAALPWLRKSKAPRIVNIASTEALGATSRDSPYAAAKAGVTGLTRALAVELGKEGITVNCICPGPILTGMTDRIPDADRATYARRRTALGRYGDPAEVGHMTVSLCLPAASFITGVTIPVDGGLMARNA